MRRFRYREAVPMDERRVIIADDSPSMREALAALIGDEYRIVANVGDGEAAVAAVLRLAPDLVILDISMPNLDGIQAARRIKQCCPRVLLIFVSNHRHESYIEAAFDAGASGYVPKEIMMSELLPAVRQVLSGKEYRPQQAAYFARS